MKEKASSHRKSSNKKGDDSDEDYGSKSKNGGKNLHVEEDEIADVIK